MVGLRSIVITLCVLLLSSSSLGDEQNSTTSPTLNPQPQHPPLVAAEPTPSTEKKPPQASPVTTVNGPVPSISIPPMKHHHHRKRSNPLSHCKIPMYAPYFVKRGMQCWCAMESYRNGCFEKIWRAATTHHDFRKVGKKCCDVFWTADKTCGLIFERYGYFVHRLKQHCSQLY
ncbi:hypothetical protein V6N13_109276 [Hibiscus sabdariffa]